MTNSVKNLYQFRTTSKLLASTGAAGTFTIGNDIMTSSAVSLTNASILLMNRTGSIKELIKGDAAAGTFTIDSRGIKPDGTTSSTYQYERPKNTLCTVVILEDQLLDRSAGDQAIIESKVYATTAARDTALGANGVATKAYTGIYVTATGLHYNYNLSTAQRESVETGATTGNASTIGAGSVEVPTGAEDTSGATIGGTGASLASTPGGTAKVIQSGSRTHLASSTGSDTYTATGTPTYTAYTQGMAICVKFTTANTGACSLNVDSLGAKSIKTVYGNDPQTGLIAANTIHRLLYDGTNLVIQTPDFATSTVRGINYAPQFAILQTNRAMNTADGTTVLAHGLSRTPAWVEVTAMATNIDEATESTVISHGRSDGTNHKCSYIGTYFAGAPELTSGVDASNCIHVIIMGSSGESLQTATLTLDATNVTINRDFTEDITASSESVFVTLFAHT